MPTRSLLREHLLIEQVLNCLETMLQRCARDGKLEAGPATEMLAFFRDFIERCYCVKEQAQLVTAMQALGISADQCLGCSMRRRCEEGETHVAAMERLIPLASDGNAAALNEFIEHGEAYLELLMEYMAKQEDCLFPMIAEALPEAQVAQRNNAPGAICDEGCELPAGNTHLELANRLADYFNVPRAVIPHAAGDHMGPGTSEMPRETSHGVILRNQ